MVGRDGNGYARVGGGEEGGAGGNRGLDHVAIEAAGLMDWFTK